MPRPRILFCSTELSVLYRNGGVGTYLVEAAKTLVQNGEFVVHLLCERDRYEGSSWNLAKEELEEFGIHLFGYRTQDCPFAPTASWPWVLHRSCQVYHRLLSLHSRFQYSMIEFAEWGAEGYMSLRHRERFSPPPLFLVRLHSPSWEIAAANQETITPETELIDWLERWCVSSADVVLSPSNFLIEWARAHRLTDTVLVLRSPNPRFEFSPSNWADYRDASSQLATARRYLIAYFGRLELRKGVTDLAEAMRRIRDPGAIELAFIGADTDRAPGEYCSMRAFLHDMLRNVCRVSFVDPLPHTQLFPWLASHADVIVIPSRWENYPNTVLEAAQLPCQLVVSDAGGIQEALADYQIKDVGIFPSGDVSSLAQELEFALSRAKVAVATPHNRFAMASKRIRNDFCELYTTLWHNRSISRGL